MAVRGHRTIKTGRDQPKVAVCFLGALGVMDHPQAVKPPCEGRLVKCHLIKRTIIRQYVGKNHEWDDEVWRWGCGGIMGNAGHHGMLDHSRTLRLPRSAIPEETEQWAEAHNLVWFLDHEYGERT